MFILNIYKVIDLRNLKNFYNLDENWTLNTISDILLHYYVYCKRFLSFLNQMRKLPVNYSGQYPFKRETQQLLGD